MDPFVLLNLPRRPMVDVTLLEKNFCALAATHHPDQATGSVAQFEQLQAAAQLLREPATRLRTLADATTTSKIIPAAAEELFSKIATTLIHAEEAIAAYHAASGALAKALLLHKIMATEAALKDAHDALSNWEGSLNRALQNIDARWPQVQAEELLSLATSFTFLMRWQKQLQEKSFLLSGLIEI